MKCNSESPFYHNVGRKVLIKHKNAWRLAVVGDVAGNGEVRFELVSTPFDVLKDCTDCTYNVYDLPQDIDFDFY